MLALNSAATGMIAQQTSVDVKANNIANLETTAFQKQQVGFVDLFYMTDKRAGYISDGSGTLAPTGVQIGLGVTIGTVYSVVDQGEPIITNQEYHMMVNGFGYFQLQDANGDYFYTRDGSFKLDPATQQIVNFQGLVLTPSIAIPNNTNSITITDSGVVNAYVAGQATPQEIGQIQLAMFPNENGLERLGNNLLAETAASGPVIVGNPTTDYFGSIQQGMLEGSNVEAVLEMTDLVKAQRTYEMCANVLEIASEMLKDANRIVAA